ncbi:MAG: hypothetical protein AAGH40_13185 [Verrucomicrobiota bacterium]
MKQLFLITALLALNFLHAEERVILHLLDPEGSPVAGKQFWIDWNDEWMAVAEKKEIRSIEAKEIINLLAAMLLPDEATHFCGHSPVYGIEAFRADGVELRTSLCFDCLTWVQPNKRMSISGELGLSNLLCVQLQKHIELKVEASNSE